MHQKRKHTIHKDDKYPERPDICDEEYKILGRPFTNEEIEKNILSHAYRGSSDLKYKCDECSLWGPNSISMEVHVKNMHAEKISCGLCGFTTRKLETLETHMNTCETFKCLECQKLRCHNHYIRLY